MSRSSRHLGLNATQQLLVRSVHHQIGSLIMQSKQIINLIALLQVVMDLQPNERFKFIRSRLLTMAASHFIFLQRFFPINSFVADIPAVEEVQDQEWRAERRILPRRSFDSYSENELRSMTRFSSAALRSLKVFFDFPEVIHLDSIDLRSRAAEEPRRSFHLLHLEELISACLHRFAHSVSIAVLIDKFGTWTSL